MNPGNNDEGRVAGSFTFNAQMPNGKTLAVSGYILAGDGEDEANQRLDMIARLVERQRLIAEIPELEKKLESMEQALKQTDEIIASLGADGQKLSSQQKQQLNTHTVNRKNILEHIERGKQAIADAHKLTAHFAVTLKKAA